MKKETLLKKLEKDLSMAFVIIMGILMILLIDVVDYITDPLLDFSLFYLSPILFCTWFGGRRLGSIMAGISAISWLLTETFAGTMQGSFLPYYYWDSFTRLGFYWVVVQLLASLRERLNVQRQLARTDGLTGCINARHFRELLTRDIERFTRYKNPFTLVYFDLDNFKTINDTLGHAIGDEVLKTIALTAKKTLRSADTIARLGGDEFAVLMPETNSLQALQAMKRLQTQLVKAMTQNEWETTCSMGGISCIDETTDAQTLIQLADWLMYEVKHEGKDNIRHLTYEQAKDRFKNHQTTLH